MWDLALGLAVLNEAWVGPLLRLVKDVLESVAHLSLSVIHKLVEGMLNLAVNVIDEDAK